MRNEFHAGDLVTVKAGGPKMTVDFVDEARGVVCCMWVENDRPRSGAFAAVQLELWRPGKTVEIRSPSAAGRSGRR